MPQVEALDGRHQARAQEEKRDEPRRVSLQSEVNKVEHEPGAADKVGAAGDVLRRPGIDARFWPGRPFLRSGQTALQLAHAREILVELLAVGGAESRLHGACLVTDGVEDAAAVTQPAHLRRDLLRSAIE